MDSKPVNIRTTKDIKANKYCQQPFNVTMSKYDFTATELRIFSCIMLKLKPKQQESYEERSKNVSHEDRKVIIENAMVTSSENYAYVKEALGSLLRKVITITTKEGIRAYHLISWAEFINNNRQIEIEVGEDVYPRLVEFNKNGLCISYTRYGLEFIFKTKSPYAIRWYMLGCHWLKKGVFSIKISTIREMFAIGEAKYKDIYNFKKRVIQGPLDIVNEGSEIEIKLIEEYKEGREITCLQFSIKSKIKNVQVTRSMRSSPAPGFKPKGGVFGSEIYEWDLEGF